jgi:virulence-associated protein VagC
MPIPTKSFQNGGSTAVRIPAEFGIKPGEELVLSQDTDGTVRVARAKPFASFLAAIERLRAAGHDPAKYGPLEIPKSGPPREVDLTRRDGLAVGPKSRKRRTSK